MLQDVSAPTSRLNLLWNILDPDVITAVDKLSHLGLLCVTVEASLHFIKTKFAFTSAYRSSVFTCHKTNHSLDQH